MITEIIQPTGTSADDTWSIQQHLLEQAGLEELQSESQMDYQRTHRYD